MGCRLSSGWLHRTGTRSVARRGIPIASPNVGHKESTLTGFSRTTASEQAYGTFARLLQIRTRPLADVRQIVPAEWRNIRRRMVDGQSANAEGVAAIR